METDYVNKDHAGKKLIEKIRKDASGSSLAEVMAAGVVLVLLALVASNGFLLAGKLMVKADTLKMKIRDSKENAYQAESLREWEPVEIGIRFGEEEAVLEVQIRHDEMFYWITREEE